MYSSWSSSLVFIPKIFFYAVWMSSSPTCIQTSPMALNAMKSCGTQCCEALPSSTHWDDCIFWQSHIFLQNSWGLSMSPSSVFLSPFSVFSFLTTVKQLSDLFTSPSISIQMVKCSGICCTVLHREEAWSAEGNKSEWTQLHCPFSRSRTPTHKHIHLQ